MDKVYELSRRERFDALLMRKTELAKSNEYYHEIHPLEAAEVDANLAAAAAAAAAKKKASAPAPATAAPPQPPAPPTPAA
jgi:NADH-quinone oxidoreductase subunit I